MITRYRNTPILLVVLALCVGVEALSAQEAILPEEIREALVWNAQYLSPITVSSTQQYRTSLPLEETVENLKILNPPADIFFAKQSRRVIWQDGKIYSWNKKEVSGPRGFETESSFDGQIFYLGQPQRVYEDGTSQPTLSKDLVSWLAETEPEVKYMKTEYHDAIGLLLPTRMKDLQANKGGSEILLLLEMGGRLSVIEDVKLDGRRTTRVELVAENPERRDAERLDLVEREKLLRSGKNTEEFIRQELAVLKQMQELPETRVYVFYLDPQMQYAVRRREERYEDGTLLLQVNNNEFEQLQGRKVWLPKKCTLDYYTWPGITGTYSKNPILSRVIEVSEFGLNPVPDKQFVLDYKTVGTLIFDRTDPGRMLNYEIPADEIVLEIALGKIQPILDLEKVKPVTESPMERDPESMKPLAKSPELMLSRKNWGWPLVILLNAIALVTLGALTIWRYKCRSTTDE